MTMSTSCLQGCGLPVPVSTLINFGGCELGTLVWAVRQNYVEYISAPVLV